MSGYERSSVNSIFRREALEVGIFPSLVEILHEIDADVYFGWYDIAVHFGVVDSPAIFDVLLHNRSDFFLTLQLHRICRVLEAGNPIVDYFVQRTVNDRKLAHAFCPNS